MATNITSIPNLMKSAKTLYSSRFNDKPTIAVCAPGRVNLLGEHTDYNDGFVFPMALPMVTLIVGKANGTDLCNVMTENKDVDSPFEVSFEVPHKAPLKPDTPKWANYVRGVVATFKEQVVGFNAAIVSSVPTGSGLSSSAALEVAMYTFLETLTKKKAKSEVEKALACQKAEHVFAGMPCGIMDQFISVMGKEDHALLLDCRKMEGKLVALKDPNIVILITNSNVKHELTGSEYPTRRKQCEEAASILKKTSLRDAEEKDLKVLKEKKADEAVIKRARHVIGEIKRTVEGADALKAGDNAKFGQLMNESHNSLRDDYEVSCPELDELVKAALEVKGVFGSRMTGAGFGGCTVTLVEKKAVNEAIEHIKKKYSGKPTFYVATASAGCRTLTIS